MKCPHCSVEIHHEPNTFHAGFDDDGTWGLISGKCPACKRIILEVACCQSINGAGKGIHLQDIKARYLAYPREVAFPLPPREVGAEFAEDFIEANRVLPISPKASAALSRRCLQHIIREKAKITRATLDQEITELLSRGTLPSHLAEAIDAVRHIGNFAAHPQKSTSSGEILDVEPGEAEWNLDVIEGMFDFYFVQPEKLKQKKAALNAKLAEAGKKPMK
jgi:hypothetical protein